MLEQRLPQNALNKATWRGNEYAWPLPAVEEVVIAARDCSLANLGGQIQFRVPEGTCELYWLTAAPDDRRPDEPWSAYVNRTADEVLSRFRLLQSRTNFVKEGVSFPLLQHLHDQGVNLDQYLCFVVYFEEAATVRTPIVDP
jgi:hypothetical protein